MACRCSALNCPEQGETRTSKDTRLTTGFWLVVGLVRLHFLVLAPWIILTLPALDLLGIQAPVLLIVAGTGLLGTLGKNDLLVSGASLIMLALIIGGKVGADLLGLAAPDTAIVLAQFVAVIFFMEASKVVLSFDAESRELEGKQDELSWDIRRQLVNWTQSQISGQSRIMAVVLGLSLLLLVVGGFTSVSINQLGFSAGLVLIVVGVLLFLVTNRKEPKR